MSGFTSGIQKAQQRLSEAMVELIQAAETDEERTFVVEALEAISSAEAFVVKGYEVES